MSGSAPAPPPQFSLARFITGCTSTQFVTPSSRFQEFKQASPTLFPLSHSIASLGPSLLFFFSGPSRASNARAVGAPRGRRGGSGSVPADPGGAVSCAPHDQGMCGRGDDCLLFGNALLWSCSTLALLLTFSVALAFCFGLTFWTGLFFICVGLGLALRWPCFGFALTLFGT